MLGQTANPSVTNFDPTFAAPVCRSHDEYAAPHATDAELNPPDTDNTPGADGATSLSQVLDGIGWVVVNADEHAATGSHVGRYQPGWNSVQVPKTGTQIRVKSVSGQGKLMQVEVRPAK